MIEVVRSLLSFLLEHVLWEDIERSQILNETTDRIGTAATIGCDESVVLLRIRRAATPLLLDGATVAAVLVR